MGKYSEKTMKCPQCGNEQTVVVWESVNTQVDEGAREKVLNRTLNTFTCEKCKKSFHISAPLLYNDMSLAYMIYYMPGIDDKEAEERLSNMQEYSQKSMELFQYKELRLVTAYQELAEKIFIFEDGLSDKIIEFLKLFLYSKFEKENLELLLFEKINDEGNLEFYARKNGENSALVVPKESYENIENMIKEKNISLESSRWERVDLGYAVRLADSKAEGE